MKQHVPEANDLARGARDYPQQALPRRRETPSAKRFPRLTNANLSKAGFIESSGKSATGGYSRSCRNLGSLYRLAQCYWVRLGRWIQERWCLQGASRRLSVCETVSLGEKRFLAIAKVDGQQFLVGGASQSVCMLARLDDRCGFAGILQEELRAPERLVI